MAKLIYSAIESLDGYVADEDGKWDWSEPDDEVHSFINELTRSVGTYLLGRRLYEVLAYWESPPGLAEQPLYIQDYAAIWRAAEKVVYSRTLESVSTDRTRIERDFDPEAVTEMKAESNRDLFIGGPELASKALEARLVDELQLFVAPAVVGGGKKSLPGNVRLSLELLDERRFRHGTVFLHYRTA